MNIEDTTPPQGIDEAKWQRFLDKPALQYADLSESALAELKLEALLRVQTERLLAEDHLLRHDSQNPDARPALASIGAAAEALRESVAILRRLLADKEPDTAAVKRVVRSMIDALAVHELSRAEASALLDTLEVGTRFSSMLLEGLDLADDQRAFRSNFETPPMPITPAGVPRDLLRENQDGLTLEPTQEQALKTSTAVGRLRSELLRVVLTMLRELFRLFHHYF